MSKHGGALVINGPHPHPQVMHPHIVLLARRQEHREEHPFLAVNERLLDWVTSHVLASTVMFDAGLVLPLLALPAPQWVKFSLIIISSNWIQWWALPAIQRSQNKTQARLDAKNDVDHHTLTYLAKAADEHTKLLKRIEADCAKQ